MFVSRSIIALVLAVLLAVPSVSSAQGMTPSAAALQAQIAALLAQIAALQADKVRDIPSGGGSTVRGFPRIALESPEKGDEYLRTEEMNISWSTAGIARQMVVEGVIDLKRSGGRSGSIGGGSFIKTIPAGSTSGSYVWDWGANDTIPGDYTLRLQLRECNAGGCALAPAGRAIGKATKPVAFEVNESGHIDEAELAEELAAAQDTLEATADEIFDLMEEGTPVGSAPDLIGEAEEVLADAEDAFDDEDYNEVRDLLAEFEELIEEIKDEVGKPDKPEIIEADLDVLDPDQGQAPFTAAVQVVLESEAPTCAVFPMGTLDWGNGSTTQVTSMQLTSSTRSGHCRQTMTSIVKHTYGTAGTYNLKFTSSTGGFTATGKVIVTARRSEGVAPSCTLTASPATIAAGKSTVLGWTMKNASYGMLSVSNDKLATSGRMTLSPAATTNYTLTVFGHTGGKGACSAKVTVTPVLPRPTGTNPGVTPSGTVPVHTRPDANGNKIQITNLEASAYSAIKSQLDEIARILQQLGN